MEGRGDRRDLAHGAHREVSGAPEEVRVRRIMTRDGISEDYARARVRAQRSEEAFRADCDEVFENNYPTPAQAAFAAEEFLDTIIKKSKEE